jgi:hypothetical protein
MMKVTFKKKPALTLTTLESSIGNINGHINTVYLQVVLQQCSYKQSAESSDVDVERAPSVCLPWGRLLRSAESCNAFPLSVNR